MCLKRTVVSLKGWKGFAPNAKDMNCDSLIGAWQRLQRASPFATDTSGIVGSTHLGQVAEQLTQQLGPVVEPFLVLGPT